VPQVIEQAITTTLALIRAEMREHRELIKVHKLALDAVIVRVEECEHRQCAANAVPTLKDNIVGLHRDVDELKSTNFLILLVTVEISEMPSTDIPASFEGPPATTRDDIRADDVDVVSEEDTDEDQLGVIDEALYDDFADLDGGMMEIARQASLRDTSMVDFSGAHDAVDSGTDAHKVADM